MYSPLSVKYSTIEMVAIILTVAEKEVQKHLCKTDLKHLLALHVELPGEAHATHPAGAGVFIQ